jgi:hypothetical protein
MGLEIARSAGPYGSALDLPSVISLLTQIQGMKLITRFVLRNQRQSMLDLEREVRKLAGMVDRFYELLGPRNWIFHDALDVPTVERLLALPADQAERALIDWYNDPEALRFPVGRLDRFPQLQVRMGLIKMAEADFHAGRYYATVLALLSVMDGFVNDIDTAERKGLHAREAEDMTAWDSVVGHHMGLTRAHASFTRSFHKTSSEPVTELYRHGIVHGVLTNFDNDVVAAKAWNRLFAVADWATSLEKQKAEPKAHSSWRETWNQLRENAEAKKALDIWRASSAEQGDATFDSDEVVLQTRDFLAAWQDRNFGRMAEFMSPLVAARTLGRTAGQVREEYSDKILTRFDLERVDHAAAALTYVDVALSLGPDRLLGRMRWTRSGPDGRTVTPNRPGVWRLMSWTVSSIVHERRDRG